MTYVCSQKKLAEVVGISEVHFSRFKQGKAKLSRDVATKACDVVGIDMYDLLGSTTKQLERLLNDFFEVERAKKRRDNNRRASR